MERESVTRPGRCIIVGAGDFFGFPFAPDEGDMVIAADAGYRNCRAAGVRPDLIVGDFDSMHINGVRGETGPVRDIDIYADAERAEYLRHLEKRELDGIPVCVIDPVKNDPDLLACARIGLEKGFRRFVFLGATGQRMDHSIANLGILGFLSQMGAKGFLYGESQIVTAITDEKAVFPEEMEGYLSVLPLSDRAEGVTESGLKYILHDAVLYNTIPTGLSNEFVGTVSSISVRKGTLLLIFSCTGKNPLL